MRISEEDPVNKGEEARGRSPRSPSQVSDDATQKIAVVNLSDEDEDKAANSEQGGEPQATADYYRCDDDQEHILEWDPSAGRFVPQTTLRARYKAADDQQVESDMDTHCGDIASPGQGTEEDEK